MVERDRKPKVKELPFKDDQNVSCGRCDIPLGLFGELYEEGGREEDVCYVCYRSGTHKVFCHNCDRYLCIDCLEEDNRGVTFLEYWNSPERQYNKHKKYWKFEEWSEEVKGELLDVKKVKWVTCEQLRKLYDEGETVDMAAYKLDLIYCKEQNNRK